MKYYRWHPRSPFTLRDARRVLGKRSIGKFRFMMEWIAKNASLARVCELQKEFEHKIDRFYWAEQKEKYYCSVESRLDHFISLLGPEWPVVIREERKKETSEVDGSQQDGDQTHGGDSASGEVPNSEGGGSETRKEDGRRQSPVSRGTAEDDSSSEDEAPQGLGAGSEQSDSDEDVTEEVGVSGTEPHEGEVTDQDDNLDPNPTGDESDSLQGEPAGSARDSSADGDPGDEGHNPDKGGQDADSLSSRPLFGGTHCSFQQSTFAYHLDHGASKDVVKALRRLIQVCDVGVGEPSPRIDGRRLVVEMVARRYSLPRAARREKILPTFLLLADVSGSCAGVCGATVGACLSIAQELDGVVVVLHSNGYPQEVWYRGHIESFNWTDSTSEDVVKWWEDLIQKHHISGCVAFGDMDAEWIYRAINRRAFFVWLDDYAACDGAKPVPRNGWLRQCIEWRQLPDVWWQGINDIGRAAIALRMAIKNKKGGQNEETIQQIFS